MAVNEGILKAERDEAWRQELRSQLKNKEHLPTNPGTHAGRGSSSEGKILC